MLRSRILRTSVVIALVLTIVNPALASVPAGVDSPSSPWMDQIVTWVDEVTSKACRAWNAAQSKSPFAEPEDETNSLLLIETTEHSGGNESEVLPGVDPLG